MKPLTIEQLKSLEVGEWAWVVDKDYKEGYYAQISYQEISAVTIDSNIGGLEEIYDSDYATKWLAYKNKEQAESKGEIVELPCKVGDIIYVPYVYRGVSDIMRLPVKEIRIIKHSIEFCTDFETDDEVFAIKFNNGSFLLGSFCNIWFTDKSEAEARLQELRGEK